MFKFPFLMQRDAMDCGPSSLGMIARYYGRRLDLERLRSECFLACDGGSLLGISKAAEKTGFRYLVLIAQLIPAFCSTAGIRSRSTCPARPC